MKKQLTLFEENTNNKNKEKLENNIERVYLSDWLFNAGIIGFLNIISNKKDIDEIENITIAENYIEFDRAILKGFSQKYFQTAFEIKQGFILTKNEFIAFLNNPKDEETKAIKKTYEKFRKLLLRQYYRQK